MFLNFDYEKPSVSLTILMFLHTVLVLPNRRFGVERVVTGILFCCFNPPLDLWRISSWKKLTVCGGLGTL